MDLVEIRLIWKVAIKEQGTAKSIHSGIYKWKMMDGNQKKFIPQLAIDTDFFHSAFVNPCTM